MRSEAHFAFQHCTLSCRNGLSCRGERYPATAGCAAPWICSAAATSTAIVGTDVATGQAQKTFWFVSCSALRGVLWAVQAVQHCTGISVSLIGFGHEGWFAEHAVQRCFGKHFQSLLDC